MQVVPQTIRSFNKRILFPPDTASSALSPSRSVFASIVSNPRTKTKAVTIATPKLQRNALPVPLTTSELFHNGSSSAMKHRALCSLPSLFVTSPTSLSSTSSSPSSVNMLFWRSLTSSASKAPRQGRNIVSSTVLSSSSPLTTSTATSHARLSSSSLPTAESKYDPRTWIPSFSLSDDYPIRRVVWAAGEVHKLLKGIRTGRAKTKAEEKKNVEFAKAEAVLRMAIDMVDEKDFGLPHSAWETDPMYVKAIPIYEDERMAIRLFVVPPYQIVPLHDHPGMLVYSRLLRGELHAFSLSWCTERGEPLRLGFDEPWPRAENDPGPFIAKCDFKSWMWGPKATEIVTPASGNLHEFQSGDTTSTFLDVFIPPYNKDRVRHFYQPEVLLHRPSNRMSHNPSFGPLSTEAHHLSCVEVGTIVKLKHIEDPKHYRINRLPFDNKMSKFLQ